MNELEALRATMTDEQRADHDLLCNAVAAGVVTEEELEELSQILGSERRDTFLAELRVRLMRAYPTDAAMQ